MVSTDVEEILTTGCSDRIWTFRLFVFSCRFLLVFAVAPTSPLMRLSSNDVKRTGLCASLTVALYYGTTKTTGSKVGPPSIARSGLQRRVGDAPTDLTILQCDRAVALSRPRWRWSDRCKSWYASLRFDSTDDLVLVTTEAPSSTGLLG